MSQINTTPTTGSPRRPPDRHWGLAIVIVVALIVVLAGGAALAARSGLVSFGTKTASPTAIPTGAAGVRAVINLANQEQQQAFAQDNPTLMRGTATAAYYAQLVAIDSQLRSSGVTSIQLRSTTFGQVTLQTSTAQATTTETWQAKFSNGSSATNTSVNDYNLVLVGGSWKIRSDTQPRTNIPPSASPGTTPTASPSPGGTPASVGNSSRNWAGYVASSGTFTGISGTWTIPTVSAATAGTDATWAGIGGATTSDLIQAGTQATVNNGVVQYSAWVETLPQASQTVPVTVNAGDSVTVTITQTSSGVWNISIQDATSGGSYTGTVNYTSSLSSAEWIEEAPSSGRGVVLLDQFGTVQFTNASTLLNQRTVSAGAAGATSVTMINNSGVQIATPSPLGAGGASFSVTRT